MSKVVPCVKIFIFISSVEEVKEGKGEIKKMKEKRKGKQDPFFKRKRRSTFPGERGGPEEAPQSGVAARIYRRHRRPHHKDSGGARQEGGELGQTLQ